MNRREFLKTIAAATCASAVARPVLASQEKKIILGAPLTHSDWVLKPAMDFGPAGVKHMLDACKACGWSHIYWRVLDGGRAMYPSKILRPGDKWDEDSFWNPQTPGDQKMANRFSPGMTPEKKKALLAKFVKLDYSNFDAFGDAIQYAHQIGMKLHAWVTINEDDHGWGLQSDFAKAHPEFRWIKRDGTAYHSQMSFAFPQVRDYKLAILKELLQYPLDGFFLDWIRTGDVRDNPQTDPDGVADSGYETPNLHAFQSEYGIDPLKLPNNDPRWIAVRAQPQTQFMRQVKQLVAGKIPVSVLVGHPWHYRGLMDKIDGNLRGLLLDVKTWAKERLMDAAVPAGYYRDGGNMIKAYNALKEETGDNTAVWTYAWVPSTIDGFEKDYQATLGVGADHMLLWEADYIDDRPNRAALQAAMAQKAR